MPATASPPADTLVSQPPAQKTYSSYRDGLVLVLDQEYPIFGPGGRQVGVEPGVRIKFEDGMLRVPLSGKIQSQQGRDVDATKVIDFLDSHRLNGDLYEGFQEIPQAAPPVTEDETGRIAEFIALHDTDRLEQLITAERGGWNRATIIRQAEQALATIREIHANVEAQQAAEKPKK